MLITLARKPIDPRLGTVVASCLGSGLGAINIDASRIGTGTGEVTTVQVPDHRGGNYGQDLATYRERPKLTIERTDKGRWPSNVLLDSSAQVVAGFPMRDSAGAFPAVQNTTSWAMVSRGKGLSPARSMGDAGSTSRFFKQIKGNDTP
jgi:hypothetical protein